MSNNIVADGEFALSIVRLTDCYANDTVQVVATEEQIAELCERYDHPRKLYDMTVQWAGHAFGEDGCLDAMRQLKDDESRPLAERFVAQYAVIVAMNWLRSCQYARDSDENPTRPL